MMKTDQLANVHVADAVAVGKAERRVPKIVPDPPESAAGHRLFAGIDQGSFPGLASVSMSLDPIALEIDREIALVRQVIKKVVFDDRALVAAANDEFVETVMRIESHDVPQDRPSAYFNQRLRDYRGVFAEPRSIASGKDHHFHLLLLPRFFVVLASTRAVACPARDKAYGALPGAS